MAAHLGNQSIRGVVLKAAVAIMLAYFRGFFRFTIAENTTFVRAINFARHTTGCKVSLGISILRGKNSPKFYSIFFRGFLKGFKSL